MKQGALILTLCTLLWAQFGKYAAYVACSLRESAQVACDCEQQFSATARDALNEDNTSAIPPLRAASGIADFYLAVAGWRLPPRLHTFLPYNSDGYGARCAAGILQGIFRPPRG